MELPGSYAVDVPSLARLFHDTTNSYKYLFFLALLDLIVEPGADVAAGRIPLRRVVAGMVARAYHPLLTFRLSFGRQDKLRELIESWKAGEAPARVALTQEGFEELRRTLESSDTLKIDRIARYVPTRLLRPFFEAELAGLPDARVDRKLRSLARDHFHDRIPIYCLEGHGLLVVHPAWIEYLRGNHAVVQAWALWEWLQYLHGHNPTTPALVTKVVPVHERAALTAQAQYWEAVLAVEPITCLYTGKRLRPKNFQLDHYLPWSFVGHDRLWNLVPVSAETNRQKGDRLPPASCLAGLAHVQALGLAQARRTLEPGQLGRLLEPFIEDLRIDLSDLRQLEGPGLEACLQKAYEGVVRPLSDLARAHGYIEWRRTG